MSQDFAKTNVTDGMAKGREGEKEKYRKATEFYANPCSRHIFPSVNT